MYISMNDRATVVTNRAVDRSVNKLKDKVPISFDTLKGPGVKNIIGSRAKVVMQRVQFFFSFIW